MDASVSPNARVIAVIPARGGSKGVPGKNVAPVGGVPLVARAVAAARAVGLIDAVVVSTDDEAIAAAAGKAGAVVVPRPAALAGDTASSESAVLHVLDVLAEQGVAPEVVAFLQATSPFIDVDALATAVRRVRDGEEDVVFSAFETYAFLWQVDDHGARGVNHDASFRPRRQDREPHFQETGAFYVLRSAGFREAGYRFFGIIGVQAVPERTALEIDDPDQLELARLLAPMLDRPRFLDIDALVMDFDGVHTDDRAVVDQDGRESVVVSRSDGMGIEMLRRAGLPMLILSKERNPVVAARAAKLQVPVEQGVEDKAAALRAWSERSGIPLSRVGYVGNDVNDSVCLRLVGSAIVVPEAHPDVVRLATLVLTRPGGRGALRELAEIILATRKDNEIA